MAKSLHAVMVPFPVQGGINPLMQLAHLLSERGFFITFVNTEWCHRRMLDAGGHALQQPAEGFRFLTIPDGLPAKHERYTDLITYLRALENLAPVLEQRLLVTLSEGIPPITCIIGESYMSCTYQLALNLRVPRVVFWTMCAALSISQFKAELLLSRGHIPVKLGEAKRAENLITCLPGNLPPLLPTDLISFYRAESASDALVKRFLYESQMQNKGDYVLVNTVEELEGREAVAALSINGCPAMAVGPLFLPNFLAHRDVVRSTSMFAEDESCLEWLDAQQPASVIYVSFGSTAVKSKQQLEEIALGLENSQRPFLWVLRKDIAQGEPGILPQGFLERIRDRGLIVRWAPQVKVLSHPSVRAFLTHSGWNSVMESFSFGIPMLGWPYFMDQFLNCRFVKDMWKIGMDFEGVDVDENKLVTREEVEKGVRRIMESEEARQRVFKLKEAAMKAVNPGGSSFLNLNKFVEEITQIAKSFAR
ncbi:7-deoxyloganetin glucosyltransferase [Cryptomeria japonica]|uniref:7-deoxyloganetin glucosyltransferase n=1 Tax=Cryptomeria japonica TaxID=3369 RepID=UPI0027DA8FDC|nr:7-deoxyloganetin glucosyltransferase [Cryptomeria japonica]